jgi:hypothetical protein
MGEGTRTTCVGWYEIISFDMSDREMVLFDQFDILIFWDVW